MSNKDYNQNFKINIIKNKKSVIIQRVVYRH